ncbi:MAG TPA: hypothetical protein ENF34_00055 [Candidatus Bathyarchaeota archaeon]|nr:MAG: hypothetical protein DRO60_05695 [Candidatus Bathyarchaeota archaeon]HDJ25697.1 hypothetical protein [Candidatus Bathyarchaeota archaeon]
MLPWWAQLIIGLVADLVATMLTSYVALGKPSFRAKLAQIIAIAIIGFVLTPISAGISGLIGLPSLASAFVLLMWASLARVLLKLEWQNSMVLALACTIVKYALVDWAGFTTLVRPWWQALL